MAFYSGTASSAADLLATIQANCVSQGWTLTGTILSKGNCYTQIQEETAVAPNPLNYLSLLGGSGISSGALVLPTPDKQFFCLKFLTARYLDFDPFAFPVNYYIHILSNPDEVYIILNYSSDRYQWAAFGCSPVTGSAGTGGWVAASNQDPSPGYYNIDFSLDYGSYYGTVAVGLFMPGYYGWNGIVNARLDGHEWSESGRAYHSFTADALQASKPLLQRMPNAWNGETLLLPIQPYMARPSAKVSMLADIRHARYVRNDNLADGEVITLGTDKWKSYPFYRKNSIYRDGRSSTGPTPTVVIDDSGTGGWAIRYDGP